MCTGLTWKGLLQEVAIDGLVGCAQGILSNEGVVAIVVVGGLVEEQAALGDLTLLVVVHVNDLGLSQGLPIVQPVQRGVGLPRTTNSMQCSRRTSGSTRLTTRGGSVGKAS